MPPPGMLPDAPPPIEAVPGDVVVLVGTTKGLFALTAGPDRDGWQRARARGSRARRSSLGRARHAAAGATVCSSAP